MLIGEYCHTIDPKKRLAIPAKLRKELGSPVVITIGLDSCLSLYTQKEWQKAADKLSSLPAGKPEARNLSRMILGRASEVEVDSLGRVLIPESLKKYAGLEKEVTIIGMNSHLEIWSKKFWEELKGKVEKNTDELAARLGEIGIF